MNQISNQPAGFRQKIVVALARLKRELRRDYEKARLELREILDEQESRAWDLTLFPHLLLPDLVESRVPQLDLRSVETEQVDVSARNDVAAIKTYEPAFAICG
jgi:hypothetical protein